MTADLRVPCDRCGHTRQRHGNYSDVRSNCQDCDCPCGWCGSKNTRWDHSLGIGGCFCFDCQRKCGPL
jgi:hypothetical protein